MTDVYAVTYYLNGGARIDNPSQADEPDLEKTRLPEGVVAVSVIGPAPIEHELDLAAPAASFFQTVYIVDAEVITYKRAQDMLLPRQLAYLEEFALKGIEYGRTFAGRATGQTPQTIPYLYSEAAKEIYPFCDNFAVLRRIDDAPDAQGRYWTRLNNTALGM